MAHVNGDAGNSSSGKTSPPVFLRDGPEETGVDAEQLREKDKGQQGVSPQNNLTRHRGEWALVSSLAIKHLDRCVSLEPKVLQGDNPDAVHDLRVATRRLQQVINLVYPSPHSGEIRKLYRGLKRCRNALSEIRNYDVLLERVDAALSRKRIARREAWEAIGDYLRELRAARLEKTLRKLAKANLSSIYVRLKECLPAVRENTLAARGPGPNGTEPGLTSEQFYTRISNALESVWTQLEQEISRSRPEHNAAGLHRTRIAAKRARYLIEVIHAFDVSGSKEALIWLRSLQTQLGDWHDLAVFEETAIGMIADRDFLHDHLQLAIQIERLILRNRVLKSKLERKYFEMIQDKSAFIRTREWVRAMVDSPAALFAGSST